MKKSSVAEKKNYPFGKYDPLQHVNQDDEEECTFQPKINHNAAKLSNRIYPDESVTDMLYRDAHERRIKDKEYQKTHKQSVTKVANAPKMNTQSLELVMKRVEKSLRNLIDDTENSDTKGQLNFENLGTILYRMGVFQNLEFSKVC